MKLGIMQPYLFPYIGYFQFIHSVETFVVYDDVNYIKGGWVNRNYILERETKHLITLPLQGASQNKLINQILIYGQQDKVAKTIFRVYKKAPYFSIAFPLIERILMQEERNLARFIEKGLHLICDYLEIHPNWCISSELEKDNNLRGQEKILDICDRLKASQYINLPGGKSLYDKEEFKRRGIMLSFIQPKPVVYKQFHEQFIPNLSIVDVIMFNDQTQCEKLLKEYQIV